MQFKSVMRIDAPAQVHAAAAVDDQGRSVAALTVGATAPQC
jgi:hypothetical protein